MKIVSNIKDSIRKIFKALKGVYSKKKQRRSKILQERIREVKRNEDRLDTIKRQMVRERKKGAVDDKPKFDGRVKDFGTDYEVKYRHSNETHYDDPIMNYGRSKSDMFNDFYDEEIAEKQRKAASQHSSAKPGVNRTQSDVNTATGQHNTASGQYNSTSTKRRPSHYNFEEEQPRKSRVRPDEELGSKRHMYNPDEDNGIVRIDHDTPNVVGATISVDDENSKDGLASFKIGRMDVV